MSTLSVNPVVLPESDLFILKRLAASQGGFAGDSMSLNHEISRAIPVKNSAFPPNTVRLNSMVEIMDLETEQVSSFRIVLPGEADIRSKKLSVLSPMGTALIGFRVGDEVRWKMPNGMKHFKIVSVDC